MVRVFDVRWCCSFVYNVLRLSSLVACVCVSMLVLFLLFLTLWGKPKIIISHTVFVKITFLPTSPHKIVVNQWFSSMISHSFFLRCFFCMFFFHLFRLCLFPCAIFTCYRWLVCHTGIQFGANVIRLDTVVCLGSTAIAHKNICANVIASTIAIKTNDE